MMETKNINLQSIMLEKGVFVDPSRFPDELFELYSIPAYDTNEPELLKGDKIGSTKKILLPNDVILSRIVPHIRRCWVVDENKGLRQIGSGEWIVFRSDKIYPNYLKYFLGSDSFNRKFMMTVKGVGGSLLRADPKGIQNIQIPFPPLSEQKRISDLLDTADKLRQKDKALLEKYDQLAQSLFLEMFGDPVKNEKGWEKRKFEELVAADCPLTYGIVQPGEEFEEGVLCVRPVDLIEQYINTTNLKKIDPIIASKFNRTQLKGGELLLSVRGSVGVISIATENLKGANVTRGIVPIWFESSLSNKLFFYYLYCSRQIQNEVKGLAKGATLIQINLADLRKLKIIVPSIELQNQFAEQVQLIEQQKELAKKNLEKSEELFGAMMGEVFGG